MALVCIRNPYSLSNWYYVEKLLIISNDPAVSLLGIFRKYCRQTCKDKCITMVVIELISKNKTSPPPRKPEWKSKIFTGQSSQKERPDIMSLLMDCNRKLTALPKKYSCQKNQSWSEWAIRAISSQKIQWIEEHY